VSSLGPLTLEGRYVRLEPLRPEHVPALLAVAQDPEIWTWLPASLQTREAMELFISAALEAEAAGREYAFAVLLGQGNRVIGSTRYLDVAPEHRRVEVGWTWYARDTWGTVVNVEAKYLLFAHAFDDWGAIRVGLKTDVKNVRSQAAIRKLGARYEGTHRSHRIRPDGTIRDTMWFSVIAEEWPEVKATLLRRIGQQSETDVTLPPESNATPP